MGNANRDPLQHLQLRCLINDDRIAGHRSNLLWVKLVFDRKNQLRAFMPGRTGYNRTEDVGPALRASGANTLEPEDDGWSLVRTRGSHRQYKHARKPGLVTIAGKPSDELAPGTKNSILKQAGFR
jgi:predicted RNA binding protein YcfA (HicA-like mRNA interferase family)